MAIARRLRMLSKLHFRSILKHASPLASDFSESRPDPAAKVCAEWLDRHSDQRKLAERWQKLETFLMREHNLFQLSEQQLADYVEAAPLDVLSDRLDELYALNKKLLGRISKSEATTTHGLSSKLLVALALVHPDENKEVHTLLQSILRDIEPNVPTNYACNVNPPS
jgi:hypothetical protein|tara:strand:- start:378733 stop:379233 length:501 start_codon:yes stop_codon:yes gene_type:complete